MLKAPAMSELDAWHDATPIQDAWLDVLSEKTRREYRTSDAHQRAYLRRQANMSLFDHVRDGNIKAVGLQTLRGGEPSNEITTIDSRFFRTFQFFGDSDEDLTQFSFAGECFREIRVVFPGDWTDGDSYVPSLAGQEPQQADTTAKSPLDSNPKPVSRVGRPPAKEHFIDAFRALEHKHDLMSGCRKNIIADALDHIKSKTGKAYSNEAGYKYLREYRKEPLLY